MRGLERMGKAVRSAPKDALISAYSVTNNSGKTFGFHKTMDIAGELSGAICIFLVLGWVVLDKDSIRLMFAATLVPGLIATCIALFFVKDIVREKIESDKISKKVFNAQDMRLLPLLLIYFTALFLF